MQNTQGMRKRMEEKYIVKSLVKAVNLLECFSVQQPEWGVSEIARKLELQKSTVYNILSTYESLGYVVQNPENGKYHLGLKVLTLGYIVNHHMGLREMFLPQLTRIAEETQETCYLGILDQEEVLYIESTYPPGQPKARNILGERAPLYCTGLGKAMLAFMPREEQERILSRDMRKYTDYTVTDPRALAEKLEIIRSQGYSTDDMEHEWGIRCIAVPVFGANGQVFAAVSVSGPSVRFNQDTFRQHADTIRRILAPLQNCI